MAIRFPEVIKMFNDYTNEILEHGFYTAEEADIYEVHLDLLQVHYQRWSNGEMLYEQKTPKG